MRKLSVMVLLVAMLFCTGCSGQTPQQKELVRVVFARGHGSTWGNQFRVEICPSEVSYAHFFTRGKEGNEFHELTEVPIEADVWEQVEPAALQLLPQLQIKKAPGLWERLQQRFGPKTVDGGEWKKLKVTWLVNGELQETEYIWTSCAEADAFELLMEKVAQTLNE